jgi:hypothetical protein
MTKIDEYVLRGQRVASMSAQQIKHMANNAMSVLEINKHTVKKMDHFIERLWDKYKINVEIISDNEWLGFAEALCDPSRFTIAIPNHLYTRIVKHRESQAIFIFFHELAHLLLGHKPTLHYSLFPPIESEDAEWQADYFADIILERLGGSKYKQLELKLSFEQKMAWSATN